MNFMEALKIFDKAKDGYLKVAVPKNFENKELEINVKIVGNNTPIEEQYLQNTAQRGRALSARFGKAKFKDYIIREDDTYYQ